jgi:hypothetical protein
MILKVANHVAGSYRHVIGEAGKGDCRIDAVDPIDRGTVSNEQAIDGAMDIHPPSRRLRKRQMIGGNGPRQLFGRFVLHQVACLDTGGDDALDPGGSQKVYIATAELMPLGKAAVGQAKGMCENRPLRLHR